MSEYAKNLKAIFTATMLILVISSTGFAAEKRNVIFIFDASGSMESQLGSKTKIALAKDALSSVIKELPMESKAGLVVYGQNRQGDCNDVDEVIALNPLDKKVFIQKLEGVRVKGMTAISLSLQKAAEKLKGQSEESMIVLISDGQENCKKDPCQTVSDLKKQGIKFGLHTIGFDIKEDEGSQLSCMAKAGGGNYFPAKDGDELKRALRKIFGLPDIARAEPEKSPKTESPKTTAEPVKKEIREAEKKPDIKEPEKKSELKETEKMIIAASVGRIRKTPYMTAELAFSLKKGDKVSVIENKSEWYHIRTEDGKTGWGHWSIFEASDKASVKTPAKSSDKPPVKEAAKPKMIREISEIRATVMPGGEERVVFVMSEAVVPKINVLKEAAPKVICDFSGVSVSQNIGSSIKVNGHLLTGIRIGKPTSGSPNMRIVLDTFPNRPYMVTHESSQEGFAVILTPEKRSK